MARCIFQKDQSEEVRTRVVAAALAADDSTLPP
jgi:hypothetical protein